MENREYVQHILGADQALREMHKSVLDQLSRSDVDYRIDFEDGTSYDLYQPITREEYEMYAAQKAQLTRRLILDAVQRLIEYPDASINDIWGTVASLQVFKTKSERTDIIVGDPEIVEITEKSIPLNVDSRYVKSQKPDITYEDFIEIMGD